MNIKGRNGKNVWIKRALFPLLCAVCTFCAIFACVNFLDGHKKSAEAGTVISGSTYTISGSCHEMAIGWEKAVSASSETKQISVVFGNDWVAEDGSFGSGSSAFSGGALCVPAGKNIHLNLNGYKLDRGLTSAREGGSVIVVKGKLITRSGQCFIDNNGFGMENNNLDNRITGGYTTGNGGGIYVDGGELELADTVITGNRANGQGGGIYFTQGSSVSLVNNSNREGKSIIGNKVDGKENNLYIADGQKLQIAGSYTITSDWRMISKIGITLENGTGVFTENYYSKNNNFRADDVFIADNSAFIVSNTHTEESTTEGEAQIVPASNDTNSAIAKKWNKAVLDSFISGGQVEFTLDQDWTAVEDTGYLGGQKSFGHGFGFLFGAINVPYGTNIRLNLNGHKIDRVSADESEVFNGRFGSVIQVQAGQLEIVDSTNSGQITGGYGEAGGITITQGGVVTLRGGKITKNLGYNFGAVIASYGIFHMYGGEISYNNTIEGTDKPSAIYVADNGSVYIYDGLITYNNGGCTIGYTNTRNRLRIYGGTFTHNTASGRGGVIDLANTNGVTILEAQSGKKIVMTDNVSTLSTGGAISVHVGAKIQMSGNIQIENNKLTDGTVRNLFFQGAATSKAITVTGAMTGSKIGVSFQKSSGQITTGYGQHNTANVNTVFFSDSTEYKVASAIGAKSEAVFVVSTNNDTIVCVPIALTSVVYNGGWQNIFEGYNASYMTVTLNTLRSTAGCVIQFSGGYIQGNQAGNYYIDVSLKSGKWPDGTDTTVTVNVTLFKADYDMSGIYMENKRVKADGTSKAGEITLTVNNASKKLPTGLTLDGYKYRNSAGTEISAAEVVEGGDYTVIANIVNNNTTNYNNPAQISAVLSLADTSNMADPRFAGSVLTQTVMYSTYSRSFTLTHTYTTAELAELQVTKDSRITFSGNTITLAAKAPKGTYEINFEIKDKNKYVWGETQDSEMVTLKITVNNFDYVTAPSVTPADGFTYDGTAHNAVKASNVALNSSMNSTKNWTYSLDGSTYSTTIPKVTNAGNYTVYWRFRADGYDDKNGTANFTVSRLNITNAAVSDFTLGAITGLVYDGSAQTPTPSVTLNTLAGSKTLATAEYKFEYSNNTNAGTANLTIVANNVNFTGRRTGFTFTIAKKNLSGAIITAIPDQTYTGSDIKPTPSVSIALKGGNTALTAGTHYTWNYTEYGAELKNVSSGNTIRIDAKENSNYTGYCDISFNIVQATLFITLGGAGGTYNGLDLRPTTVTFGNGASYGLLGTDATTITKDEVLALLNLVKGESAVTEVKNVGAYTATVNWSSTREIFKNYKLATNCNAVTGYNFNVTEASISASNVNITGNSWIFDGQEHDAILSSNAPTVTGVVEGNGVTWQYSKDGSAYSSMVGYTNVPASGTTYTVHYKVKVENYSEFSGTFSVTVSPRELSTAVLALTNVSALTYNGTAQVPAYTVKDTVAEGNVLTLTTADYTVAYANNINAGTNAAEIRLTGKGNYTGSATLYFSIAKKELDIVWTEKGTSTGGSGGNLIFTYNGQAQGYTVSADGVENGETVNLTVTYSGTDYAGNTISALPVNAGASYTMSVALVGYDNYYLASGATLSKSFAIDKKNITSVGGITAKDREYNGGTDAELVFTGATFNGIVAGDSLTVVSATGAFERAGYSSTAWSVAISGITLGGDDVHNYMLVNKTATTTAKINQRVLNLVWGDLKLLFNGSERLPTVTADNIVDGEELNFRVTRVGSEPAINPGEGYKARATLLSGTYSGNYVLPADPTTEFEIYSNNIVVYVDGSGLSYDGGAKLPLFKDGTGKVLSLTEGTDFTVTLSAKVGSALTGGKAVNAGEYTAVITISPAYMWWDSSTYQTSKSFDFTIDKAETDISGVTFGDVTHTYNGALPAISAGNLPDGVANVTYSYFKGETAISANEAVNAGIYTVVAEFTLDSNHKFKDEIVSKRATLTVNKAVIDLDGIGFAGVSGGSVSIVYDGKAHNLALSGTADGVAGVSYTYTKNNQTVSPESVVSAGEYRVTATFTPDSNHQINGSNIKTAVMSITKAPLTVIAGNSAITYGDAPKDGGAVFNGLVGGESEGVLGTLGFTIDYTRYGNIGEYSIVVNEFAGAGASNYDITYVGGKLTVTPLELQVRWQRTKEETSTDFTYTQSGSTRFAPHAVVLNAVNNDILTLTISGATSEPGLDYTAEVTAINGAKSGNYTLPVTGLKTSFSVLPEPKSGKIIWDNATLYYNGEAQLPKAYYYASETDTNPVELEVIAVGSTAPVNAGRYTAKVNTSLALSGNTTKEFTIERREVFVNIGNLAVNCGQTADLSKVGWTYAQGSAEFLANEIYTISFTCDYGAGAIGSYPIYGHFASANASNYKVTFVGDYRSADGDNGKCGVLTVAKASFNPDSLTFLGTEVTYDGKKHTVTVLGLPEGVEAVVSYKKGEWSFGADGVIGAGEYEATIDFIYDPAVYNSISSIVIGLTVNKASLDIKANDAEIFYGDEARANGYTVVGGLVAGDGENVIGGAISFTFGGYSSISGVGKYVITPSGLSAENYEINYIPGALTVRPRVITVTWFDYETGGTQGTHFTYKYTDGNTEYKPFAQAGGLVNGDSLTLEVTGGRSGAGTGYIAKAVLSNPNYALPTDGTAQATFDILPDADNVVVWESEEVVYSGNAYAPAAYYFKDGEKQTNVTVTVYSDKACTSVAAAINAGTYYAKASAAGETLTNNVYSFTVQPREIHITVENKTAVYGGAYPAFTAVYTAGSEHFVASDGTISTLIILTCEAGANASAGTYRIAGEFADNANYKVFITNGTLTVERKVITSASELPALANGTAVYDGRSHTLTANISGYGMIDGVKYVYYRVENGKRTEISASDVVNAGRYIVRAVYSINGNYTLADGVEAFAEAELEIAKATLGGNIALDTSVTSFTYDGKAHTLPVTGSATGIKEIKYTYYRIVGGSAEEISAEQAVNVGVYRVSVSITFDNDNYTYGGANPLTGEFTITPARLTVTLNGSLVYGDALSLTAEYAQVSGLIGDDTLAGIGLEIALDIRYNKDGYGKDVGEYVIALSGAATCGNYSVEYVDGTLTVTPRTINAEDLEWFSNEALNQKDFTYVYSAGASYHPYAKVKDGVLVSGDSVSFIYGEGKSGVGFGYTVKITGTGNGNYVLPANGITSCEFDILEQPVKEFEIVWDYSTLYYNGKAQKPEAYYYDETGARQQLEVTVDEGSAVSAGTYTARAVASGLKLTGDSSLKFSIEKRPVFIRVGDATAVYGETPNMQAVEWSYEYANDESTHIVAGEQFNVTFSYEALSGIGKYKISGHFSSNKSANYAVTFTGAWVSADEDNGRYGVLTVTKATLDLKGVVMENTDVVYDGTFHKVTLTGVPSGIEYKVSYKNGAFGFGSNGVKDAGTYEVTVSYSFKNAEEAKNYNALADGMATLTVRKAPITIKASDNAIVYGEEADGAGVDITGFVNGETLETSDLTGGAVYTINYARYGSAGRYRISVGGFSSNNYAITYVAGTLTVNPRAITVEWFDDETRSSQNFVYSYDGATKFKPYAVAGNLVNGDKLVLEVIGATEEQGVGHVATARISGNGNYVLPADGTASVRFDIIPAPYTVVWEKTPLYYNGTAQKPSAFYYDADGIRHELAVTVDEAQYTDAGTYTARIKTVAGITLNGTYYCTYDILKLNISIIIKDVAAVYGGSIPFATEWWSYADGSDKFIGSDGGLVTRNSLSTDAVGAFDITASFGGNTGNYNFSFTKGTLTVSKAEVSGTPAFGGQTSFVYDGDIHGVTVDISGLAGVTGVVYTYEKDGVNYGSNGVTEAGTYLVTAHFTADSNHIAPADIAIEITVTPAEIDIANRITFNSVTDAVYNGIAHTLYISGAADGVTGVTYTYEKNGKQVDAGDVIGVGEYKVTARFTADSNHGFKGGLNYLTATLTINPAKITVKANTVNVVYGETAKSGGYTVSGLAAGDTETSIGLSVNITISGYTAGSTNVGTLSGAVTLSASAVSANYTINSVVSADLVVTPRVIEAGEVKWYDREGGTQGTRFEYTYSEGATYLPYAEATVNGQKITFTVSGAQTEIGDNYTATITAVNNGNYALPVGGISVSFSIMGEQKAGTIIWDNTQLYYNGQNLRPTAYYLVDGSDEKHYLEVSVLGSSAMAGTYTATVSPDASLNLTGATSMQFKVLPLPVIIVIGDKQVTYGEQINLTDWSYAEGSERFLDGESFTIRLTYGGQKGVGKYKISAEFRSANGANYDVKFTGSWASGGEDNGRYGTLTIVKANIDVSALTVEGTSVNYDGKPHAITVKGLPAGVEAFCSYSLGGWTCNPEDVIKAGVYDVIITFSVDDAENYNSIPAMTAQLTINQAVITVTAYDHTITYGDRPSANPLGAEITGVDPSELRGTLTFSFDYRQYGSAGKYTITPSGLTSDNYAINFVAGVLTVEKRIVTIEWFDDDTQSSKTFKYSADGVTVFRPFAVAGNLVNGDTAVLTIEGGSADAGLNFSAKITGISNSNYALPQSGISQSFDVVPASRVIVWDNTQLYYNGEKQAPKAYYFDETGARVDLAVTVNGESGVEAVGGDYIAIVTGTGLTGIASYSFSILPREITIVIDSKTAVYGNVEAVKRNLTCSLADGSLGFVGGDSLAIIALTCTATDLSGVGTYAITASCANGNYNVTVIEGTLTVEKAKISVSSVTFAGGTVNYDGAVHSITADISAVDGIAGVTYEYYLKNSDGSRTLVSRDGVKNAGEYEIVATFTADANHEFTGNSYKSVTLLIMQAQISGSIDFENGSFVYDSTEKELYASSTASGVTGVTYTYYRGNYVSAGATLPAVMNGLPVDAGEYTVVATFTVEDNYLPVAPKRALLTIEQATLTVTANGVHKTYGYNLNNADFGYSYTGLAINDNFANLSLGVSITVNYGADPYGKDAGTYDIIISGLENTANYNVIYVNGTLTVTPRVIEKGEITWQAGASDASATLTYEYDGAEHLPYAFATAGGETVVLTVTGAQVNAGIDYLAVITGIVNNPNFALPAEQLTVRFTITPKPVDLHIVWEETEVYYDGNPHAPKAYFTVENDSQKHYLTVTVDGLTEVTDAGDYTAEASLSDGNYVLTGSNTMTFTVLRGRVYINISDASVSYGEVDGINVSYTYGNGMRLDGEAEKGLTFTLGATNTSNVGKYPIYGSFAGDVYTNYEVVFTGSWISADEYNGKCGTLEIGKATINMSGITISDRSSVYNGKLQQLTVSNLPAGVTASYTYTLGGWGFGNGGVKNAGAYDVKISFSIDDSQNYYPVADLYEQFTITRAPLTVKAGDNTIVYGDEAYANGVEYIGFAEGEDERALSGTAVFGFDYVRYGRAGKYEITVSGLTSSNYAITFEKGVLTVSPREISVSWYSENGGNWGTEFNYNYDGTIHQPYAVAGNTVNNDALILSVEGGQHETGIGYIARVTAIFGNPNYVLPSDGTAQVTFNILPDAYTIVWESTNFVYNGNRQYPKAYYFTQYGGMVELNVKVDRYSADAGEYVATASLKSGDHTPINGEFEHVFTIGKLAVSIVIHDSQSEYGDPIALDPNGWHYADGSGEFADGNFITLNCSVEAGYDVGSYPNAITCDFSNPNYDITYRNGTYTVVRKVLSTPVFDSVDYDGKAHMPVIDGNAPYYVASSEANITRTDVGTSYVTLALKDFTNYVWEATALPTVIVPFTVNKVDNGWQTGYEFAVQGGTVEANSGRIEFSDYRPLFDSTITIKYYRDAGHVTEVDEEYVYTYATLGETFYIVVTVEGTDNFNTFIDDSAVITVVGRLKVTLEWIEETLVYDGFEQAPRAYIWIGKERVWLEVEGSGLNAGEYTATAKRVALDGRDLSAYEFTNADGDFERNFTIEARKLTVSILEGVSIVYGSVTTQYADFAGVVWSITSGRLAENDTRDSLNVTFSSDFGGKEYADVGHYVIEGSWNNGNYEIEFTASSSGEKFYEVTKASITVDKTGSEWVSGADDLEDGALIDRYQNYFVTLDEKDADGKYKYINLKGDQSAEVKIRYSSLAYNYKKAGDIPLMSDKQIAQFIDENQTTAPAIRQAGVWVVYYRIEEDNHVTKYGQWRVLILKNTDYVTITFDKPYKIEYGDSTVKNIINDLIDGGYISVSGAITDLEVLRRYVDAYAYEDVTSGTGVDGASGVNGYTVRFSFNDNALNLEEFANIEFRYKDTNDPNVPDTNLGAYRVEARTISADWGVTNFVYDGTAKIPTLKITGLIGGEVVELETKVGETTSVTLKNGDVINFTVTLLSGSDMTNAGSYRLSITLDNPNYKFDSATGVCTVNIVSRELDVVWGEKQFVYDGETHLPELSVGGKQVAYDLTDGTQKVEITLDNGDTVTVVITLVDGVNTRNAGTYTLQISIEGGNYTLSSANDRITVSITDTSKIGLPTWAIGLIIGAIALAILIILILAVVLKKRKKQVAMFDEDGFSDEVDDYEE